MENLGDILKRIDTTRSISPNGQGSSNGDSSGDGPTPPGEGTPADTCGVCGGIGWFTLDVPAGHPEFGRIITCQCQQRRMSDERSERLLRYSNLGHLARFTFDNLSPEGRSGDAESRRKFQEACRQAREYAESPRGWLVIAGPHGTGKTHLAAALASHAIELGHVVFFVHVPDLLDHLRATFAPGSEVSYSELFEQVRNVPLLILDGVGSHSTTPWAEEKLRQIVNHRFNAQLPTVLTTASEIGELDPYLRARLSDRDTSRVLETARREMATGHRLGQIEPEMLRRMTFDTFDTRGNNTSYEQRASLQAACKAASNFAADPDGWLTIFGETGVGKTHLAVAIAAERIRQGQPVFFAFVPELMDYLRYTFTPESRVTYDQVFEEVKNCPLLVLDDLGQEHSSPWADEKLYQIIVHRHNARLPTVITSMQDLSDERGPIGSRVRDPSVGQLVRIDASDYRIKERGGRQQGQGGQGGRRGQGRYNRGAGGR